MNVGSIYRRILILSCITILLSQAFYWFYVISGKLPSEWIANSGPWQDDPHGKIVFDVPFIVFAINGIVSLGIGLFSGKDKKTQNVKTKGIGLFLFNVALIVIILFTTFWTVE